MRRHARRPATDRSRRLGTVIAASVLVAAVATGCAKTDTKSEADRPEDARALAAPPIIREMIAAHGGMDRWLAAPAVSFEDEFVVPGNPPSASRVVVEQGRRRAYLEYPAVGATAAWDGDSCWSTNWKSPLPPRFLIYLNYYFLNVPWLTMDPGVRLAAQGSGRLVGDPTEYETVLMTFEPGTGDTPKDYYRLHIDPATKRLKGYEYVATYRAILPKGVPSSPENTLVYDSLATVSGLVVPVKYTIYGPDQKIVATCTMRSWSFDRPFDESRLRMPSGGAMDRSTP